MILESNAELSGGPGRAAVRRPLERMVVWQGRSKMQPRLTDKAVREIEEQFALQREAEELLEVIVAEWETDPLSVQCFDLRTVERAKYVSKRLKKLRIF